MSTNIVGQIIAKQFRVDAFISAGGMGSVYRVWDLKRNVPLAMKVLHTDLAEDPVIFERFKREARALKKLEHPNIVPFYGLYETPSLTFLLERFIDGPTLKDILAQRSGSPLPDQDVLCIIKSLCSAVGYAHNNNVIHCDIKAANVLIDRGGHVYLGDFGIARHAESDVTAMPGAGTPAYMTPEQIMGNTVSQATDIYSLGILLFELLTGRRPFRGTESGTEKSGQTVNERIRFAQLNLPAPDPHLINPRISPQLSAVVLRALEKDPSARFASCQGLLSALCEAFNASLELIPDRISVLESPQEIDENSKPIHPHLVSQPSKNLFFFIGGGAVLILLFVIMSSMRATPVSLTKELKTEPIAKLGTTASRLTNSEASSSTNAKSTNAPPESTLVKKETSTREPTSTRDKTSTPRSVTPTYGSCPGAEPQQVRVGDKAVVCTKQDRLILRSAPPPNNTVEIFRMYPRTKLQIIDGPICANESTWWKVRVEIGSWVFSDEKFLTTTEYEGWVREGSDDEDTYYICPLK